MPRFLQAARIVAELELELIQTQMTQIPKLRAEVYAYAMRAKVKIVNRKCVERSKYSTFNPL